MTALYLAAPFCGLLLLAAHFFRSGSFLLMAVCVLMIALLFVRRTWSARAMQAMLLLGALEWLRTAVQLANARMEAGDPYMRLAFILGGVALFTALSTIVFQTPRLKRRFGFTPAGTPDRSNNNSPQK